MVARRVKSYKASGRKRTVQIQEDTGVSDGQGGRVENWTTVEDLGNVPMEFQSMNAYMQFQAQQLYPGVNSRATMRYRKSAPVTPAMRVVSGTHIYAIRGVMNYDEADETIQLYLEELQAKGSTRS